MPARRIGQDLVLAAAHTTVQELVDGPIDRLAEQIPQRDFDAAIPLLEKIIEIYPGQSGAGSAYASLAAIYRDRSEDAALVPPDSLAVRRDE